MKKTTKYFLYAAGVIILIGIISVAVKDNKQASTTTTAAKPVETATTTEPKKDEWKQVIEFNSNGTKNSETIHLNGGELKIVYDYNSGIEGVGVFGVYIMSKGTDINTDGGLPDIMSSEAKDAGESALTKSAGDYYIHVNAQGKYKIKLLEKQ